MRVDIKIIEQNPMSKFIFIITATAILSLVSCIPPEPPPRPYKPIRTYDSEPEPADWGMDEVTPPAPPLEPEEPQEPKRPKLRQATATGRYPIGTVTTNPDQVLSPFKPYSVIDISGPPRFKSGQLARDPSNQKIFRIP
jgi:hypothetical protein